jgi:flagellar biosynthesis anti-sigma factor FlgM
MKVNDPNLTPAGAASTGAAKPQESGRTVSSSGSSGAAVQTARAPGDDVHLSELVRSLRSLAAESPERQARIESIARSYAQGSYQVDAQATADGIIRDALGNH